MSLASAPMRPAASAASDDQCESTSVTSGSRAPRRVPPGRLRATRTGSVSTRGAMLRTKDFMRALFAVFLHARLPARSEIE